MGYLVFLNTGEVLGDELGIQKARRDFGLSHRASGKHVTQADIEEVDREGDAPSADIRAGVAERGSLW